MLSLVLLVTALLAACSDAAPPSSAVGSLDAAIESVSVDLQSVRSREDWGRRLVEAVDGLRELRDARQTAGDLDGEARVRVALGRHLSMSGEHAAAAAELEWVSASAAPKSVRAAALSERAANLWRQADYVGCKALLEQVLREFPGTPGAAKAPQGIANCERELAR